MKLQGFRLIVPRSAALHVRLSALRRSTNCLATRSPARVGKDPSSRPRMRSCRTAPRPTFTAPPPAPRSTSSSMRAAARFGRHAEDRAGAILAIWKSYSTNARIIPSRGAFVGEGLGFKGPSFGLSAIRADDAVGPAHFDRVVGARRVVSSSRPLPMMSPDARDKIAKTNLLICSSHSIYGQIRLHN